MAQDYVVQLSNSIYMGSDGAFTQGAPQGVPILPSTRFELPVEPTKVKDTLNSIAAAVKSASDPKSTTSLLLRRLGITGELLTAFKDFGKLAGDLAKFVPYVQAAYALLDFIGLLGEDEQLSPALKQQFEQINALIIATDRKWTEIASAEAQNPVFTHLDTARTYASSLMQYEEIPPKAVAWTSLDLDLHDNLSKAEGDVLNSLKNFLTPALWRSDHNGRDPEDPEGTWDALRPLNLVVQDQAGNWQPAPIEPIGKVLQFDHRAMCHLVPGLIQSYLATIKLLLPEFRSTGRFRAHFLSLSDLVEDLLKETRQNLTRTSFGAYDFPNPAWLPPGHSTPPRPRFDAGAFDLAAARNYTPNSEDWPTTSIWDTSNKMVEYRAMAYNWDPGADYRTDGTVDGQGWSRWDLYNTADCVKALNDESGRRFSQLLYSSGYLQLAQTSALLKHLCSAPELSETVDAGFRTSSKAGTSSTVEVEAKAVIPFDPIKASATRIPYSVHVTAKLLMQSPLRSVEAPLTYKVYLRTLTGRRIDCRSDYSSYYWTGRERKQPDPAKPNQVFDVLRCYHTTALDEHLLVEGHTPRTVDSGGTPQDAPVSITVDTFDIWVPVPDAPALMTDVFTGIEATTASTATGQSQSPYFSTIDVLISEYLHTEPPSKGDDADVTPPLKESSSGAPPRPDLGGSVPADPRGERRNLKRDQVSLHYEWTWNGPILEIQIDGAATNPNADVYLVVEEQIVDGEWRHTAYRIPLASQLTYVPQSFLNAEAKLTDDANSFWRGLVSKYVEAAALGPEDPIVQVGRVSLADAEQRLLLQAIMERQDPEFLAQYTREYERRNASRKR